MIPWNAHMEQNLRSHYLPLKIQGELNLNSGLSDSQISDVFPHKIKVVGLCERGLDSSCNFFSRNFL